MSTNTLYTAVSISPYVDGLRIGAPYVKALYEGLRNAAPDDADPLELEQIDLLGRHSRELDTIVNERDVIVHVRPELTSMGAAFGAMHDALLAIERLPRNHSNRPARAEKVRAQAFPEGIAFTRQDAYAAWSDGDRHVRRIQDEGLRPELEALIGPEFFPVAKKATASLGETLGVGRTKRITPSSTAVADKLFVISRVTARYCRLLAASLDETDPASIERFRKAVAPIDELRTTRASGNGHVIAQDDRDQPEPAPPTPVIGPVGPGAED